MARLNHVNIKQEKDDEQKEVSINNTRQQQNNEGHDASSCQLSVRTPKHVKKEEEGEDGIVKQVQSCTKVKKEEVEDGECIKLEWDGDECDCEECRVDRQIKVEFNPNNAIKNSLQQDNRSPWPSSETEKGVPSQSSVCKRVKKEEEEDGELIGQWDEDCDCDDCRRMRLKAIRLKQINDKVNQGVCGDDGEDTEIDEDGDGSEDVLVGNDGNVTVDDLIGDIDDKTEIDDEDYEMEVDDEQSSDGDAEETEQFGNQTFHVDQQPSGQIVEIDEKKVDEETEIEYNEGNNDDEDSRTLEGARIERTLPHSTGQTRKIIRKSSRHLKRKQTDECPHCHKSFDHRSQLKQHLRVHTGERPFHCDLCDKRFNLKGNLTKHQLIHQSIKRFRCDQCDKRFSQNGCLARHQLIHKNVKNFQCGECQKQFNRKDQLDSHLLIHSGERPFQCRHCDKLFSELGNRTKHEQAIHLQVKPYRCKQCGYTATQRSHVIRHIRVVHFGLLRSIKEQKALNIVDDRDPKELIEKV